MRRRTMVAVLALAGTTAALLGWRADRAADAEARAGIERSLLRKWALDETGIRKSAAAAGISFQRAEVIPLDRRALGSMADEPAFRVFLNGCTSCHVTPDPSMHAPREWRETVPRMMGWMEKAGLFPLPAAEQEEIVRFLERAAREAEGAAR